MEVVKETPVKKPKRLTSVVWNHFERVRKADICHAVCLHCNKKLSGSSNSGTTHLRNHLIRCLKRSNHDVSQLLSAKRKRRESAPSLIKVDATQRKGEDYFIASKKKDEDVVPISSYKFDQEQKKDETINLGSVKFDQERSRLDLAHMIMLHGYPLAIVEDVGFKVFVKNLQPLFEVISNSAIELDCMTIYAQEKQKVYERMHNLHGKISLAVGLWGSPENVRYLCLVANFIDEDWKFQKKMLGFITLDSSQTDDRLSEVLMKCLMDWGVNQKLFTMTFDDCSTYDDLTFKIKECLSQNKPLLKNGELFDMRCAVHVLKSIAQDATEALRDVTRRIRESVMYVRSSQATLEKFNELARQVGITSEKPLIIDSPTRWNSTYLMLETAIEYRGAFALLQDHVSACTVSVSESEWEWATSVTGYMKLFVDVINVFTGNKHPTANVYFPEICDVHIQLIEWCESPDECISSMALKMKAKFDKYWSKCSLALAIAAILDPRFKMKLVEYYYRQIYDGDADDHIKEVSDGLRELFNEYYVGRGSAQPGSSLMNSNNGTRDSLRGFDKFLQESSHSQSAMSDLDKYLEEPVFPRNYDFNILNWWKVHTPRYPILSLTARDVLGISMSTLTADLAFSTTGRVLDHRLSSLNPDTRQALICGQDWLQVELEEKNRSSSQSFLVETK